MSELTRELGRKWTESIDWDAVNKAWEEQTNTPGKRQIVAMIMDRWFGTDNN